MTDDQVLRIVFVVGVYSLIQAFKPQIKRIAHRFGYRDGPSQTGWRRGGQVIGFAVLVTAIIIILA